MTSVKISCCPQIFSGKVSTRIELIGCFQGHQPFCIVFAILYAHFYLWSNSCLFSFFLHLEGKCFVFFLKATWNLNKGCCLNMAYFICSCLCHLLWCRQLYGIHFLPLQVSWRTDGTLVSVRTLQTVDVIKGFC